MLVEKNFVPGNGWKKVSFGTMKNIRIILDVNIGFFPIFMEKDKLETQISLKHRYEFGNIDIKIPFRVNSYAYKLTPSKWRCFQIQSEVSKLIVTFPTSFLFPT